MKSRARDVRSTRRGFTVIEALIVIVTLAIVALVIVGSHENSVEFKKACDKRGGEVVYDGRQYQCLPPSPTAPR